MANSNDTVVVKRETLENLIEDSLYLSALEEGGVDNWSWYGEAIAEKRNSLREQYGIKEPVYEMSEFVEHVIDDYIVKE